MGVCMGAPWHSCGDQKDSLQYGVFILSLCRFLGIELKSTGVSGLVVSTLTSALSGLSLGDSLGTVVVL